MTENVFCFMLRAFVVLEVFAFLSCLFGYVEKRLYVAYLDIRARQQINTLLLNFSRSTCTQAIKCDLLIKFTVRNIFL